MTADGLLRHLQGTVQERVPSLSRFAQHLGRRDNWLRRKLQGTRPLTVDELYEMLDALGLSASEFFDGYVQQENPT
ncbi:MAG: hypothetical protein AAGD06_31570, partial [Acidobacteriota bacterium]